MNVGFDLDKIFINLPPLVPDKIIELLYKEKSAGSLKYRIPGKAEQIIRVLSHHPLFRPPISKNIDYVRNLSSSNSHKYYLVSSRFGFLKKRTSDVIKTFELDKIFNAMYFNYFNQQPHMFKNQVIQKLKIDRYVDDDLELLRFLAKKNPKAKFFWLNSKQRKAIAKNLFAVNHLSEIFQ